MTRRFALVAATTSLGMLALAGTASAHIEPDPSEAQAGSNTTIGFTVEHGCEGSPTVEIEMRLPEGVADAVPEPTEGWDESIDTNADDDTIVTFANGSLPADVKDTFEVTMTLPPTPDTTIYFPFVQHCEVGEIRWIALPDDSGDEPDEPAPALDLIGPVVTTTTTPSTTVPEPTVPDTAAPSTEAPPESTPASSLAITSVPLDTTPSDTVAVSGAPGENDGNTGTIAFIVSVLAVFLVGGIAFVTARRKKAADGDQGPNGPTGDGGR